jgi:predicted ester cyclase
MSTQTPTAHVRRFYDEVWNHGQVELVDDLNAPSYQDRTPAPGLPPTSEGVKHLVAMYRTAFPDVHFTVDEVLVEGDRVAVLSWLLVSSAYI